MLTVSADEPTVGKGVGVKSGVGVKVGVAVGETVSVGVMVGPSGRGVLVREGVAVGAEAEGCVARGVGVTAVAVASLEDGAGVWEGV
jgi:hypothetical protein